MRTATAVAGVALALSLAGCGGGDSGYPDAAREAFMRDCRAQPNATEATCGCVLEELERTVPYAEFRRGERALRGEGTLDPSLARKLQEAVSGCLAANR